MITVQGGALTNVQLDGASQGKVYTASFTPHTGAGATSIQVVANQFTDLAGNSNTSVAQQSGSYDTVRPTVALSLPTNHSGALKAGESVELTLSFTEAVNGLSLDDITVPSISGPGNTAISTGRVTNLVQSTTDAKVYTLTYTPAQNLDVQTVQLRIGEGTFTDLKGNLNTDGAASASAAEDTNNAVSLSVDTKVPTITGVAISGRGSDATTAKTALTVDDFIQVDVSFSETLAVNNGTLNDQITYALNVGGFTQYASLVSTSGSAMTFRYKVRSGDLDKDGGITAVANALSLGNSGGIADAAGNAADLRVSASGTSSGNGPATNTLVVDTPIPVVSIQRVGAYAVVAQHVDDASKQTDTVVITFSKPPQATVAGQTFNLANILAVDGGSFGAWTSTTLSSGAVEYRATFTPATNRTSDATISIAANSFKDTTGIFRFIKYETGSDTITDFNLGDGDKIDLRGLLADTGFSLDKLSLYLNLSGDLSQQTLKVDTLGSGNFGSPDLTVVMSNPSGINDGLSTLIDQRVFMV